MFYSVLRCGAVCRCVLQCVVVCCSVLRCVAVCTLPDILESISHTSMCGGVLQCIVCNVLRCSAVCHSVLQCAAVYRSDYTARHSRKPCSQGNFTHFIKQKKFENYRMLPAKSTYEMATENTFENIYE